MRLISRCETYPFHTLWGDTPSQDQQAVDTEADVVIGQATARVYLSRRETWEAARLYGFLTPELHDELAVERDQLAARVAELEGQLAQAEPVLNAVREAMARQEVTVGSGNAATPEELRPLESR